MALDNVDAVDAIGTENGTSTVVLSILDSWDWNDERSHLVALQAKLNAYLGFIESGQIYQAYPASVGKLLRIDVIARDPIPNAGLELLSEANAVAAKLGVSVAHRKA